MTMLSSTPIPMSISTSNPTSSMAFSSPAAFMGSSGFSSTSSASSPSSSNVRPIHDIAFSSYAFSTSAASLLGVSSSSLTSASLASPAAVVHSGTLLKRQPLFTWSERYVLLTSSEFFWYKRDRHSPLPATFHHSAPSFSSSSPSPSPAPAPAPSPAAVWGEERGHWYVADIAIRYESEKRTFVLANTNMSASAQLQSQSHSHQSILQLVKETSAERERDSQHEIHLKATNDFEYLAWQHAFQQVIRNQEKKKSERNKNVKEKEKEKEKEQSDERTTQKHENEEETLRKMAAVLPLHQRHNSAPFSPEAGEPLPASISDHTQNRRVRPLTHPTLTPPPSSSAEPSSNSSFLRWNSTPNSSGMRKKRSSEPPQRTRTTTSNLKHLNIESESNTSKCPAIYLVSVILPPSLLTSILPGFSSSLFPLLLWPIPSNSAPALSEFVIHRPLSSFSSSSSASSAVLSSSSMFPVSFLVPSILCCATSLLRFTLTDGTLLNFPLSRLHEDSLISNRQQGKITVSDAGSGVEVDVQWEEREDNQTRRRRKETGQKCTANSTPAIRIYAVLAALLLCSVFYGAWLASSSTFTMLCMAFAFGGFFLLAAAQNCLWSRAGRTRGKNYYVLNVTALRVKEASDRPLVDLKAHSTDPAEATIDKSMAGLRKRVPSSSKPGSGFVSVQSHTQSYRQKNDLQVASQTFDLVSNILLTGKQ